MRDLVVVGGGPVGLATALYAARAGLSVEVHEARRGVIDKACGEGLMPGAVAGLAELGVHPDGCRIDGIRYVSQGHSAQADFRHGPGRGVRRTTLHEALLAAVSDASVPIVHRRAGGVQTREGAVEVNATSARYVIAADGLHSSVRRSLGLDATGRSRRRFGLRCHVSTPPWSSYVEVFWSPLGEAYVTPVSEHRVGIAVLSDQRVGFSTLLGSFPALQQRMPDEVTPGQVRGAGPLRQRSSRRVSGRVLLVGDAAGYVDALTGEGIAVGLAQARAAVQAVLADDPSSYERAWRRVTRRHDLLTKGLLGATRFDPVRSRIVPAAAALPRVFDVAVNALARPA